MRTPLLNGLIKAAKHGVSYSFSSTQVQLSPEIAKAVKAKGLEIPDEDLYAGEERSDKDAWNGFGRENDFHITLKYGLHTIDPGKVRKVLENEAPVTVTMGKLSFFHADDYDVLKCDVKSNGLKKLNKLISDKLKCTDTFPVYKPHATIAYVKKGKAKDLKWGLEGKSFIVDEIIFSGKDGKRIAIKLKREGIKKVATPLLDGIIKQASTLTTRGRKQVAKKNFAMPASAAKSGAGQKGSYPIFDRAHARSALTYGKRYLSGEEYAKLRARVYAKYPNIKKD